MNFLRSDRLERDQLELELKSSYLDTLNFENFIYVEM